MGELPFPIEHVNRIRFQMSSLYKHGLRSQ